MIPGKDGVIRGAQISVSNRNGGKVDLYRPIQKLYPLEVSAMTETQLVSAMKSRRTDLSA